MEHRVKFKQWNCIADFTRYANNGRLAIQLFDEFSGERIAVATTNIEGELPDGFVALKVWSENAGMLEAMMEAGIVGKPEGYVQCGFATAPVCRVLVEV